MLQNIDGILIGKLIIVILLFLLIVGIFAYNAYMSFGFLSKKAPYIGSFKRHLYLMKSKLKLKKGASLLDLGCGDGKAMRFFRKQFELGQISGYEVNITAIFRSRILNTFHKPQKFKIYHKDFQKADISNYDYVYIYLLPEQLAKIDKRLFSNMGEKTVVITNSFRFKKHKPFKIIKDKKGKESIFLYMTERKK